MQYIQHIIKVIQCLCQPIVRNDACIFEYIHLQKTTERANYWQHLKETSDPPFKNITVGTAINTTTTATPKTPRSTFAMRTCPRREEAKLKVPALRLTPTGKREKADTNHCFLCVSKVPQKCSNFDPAAGTDSA